MEKQVRDLLSKRKIKATSKDTYVNRMRVLRKKLKYKSDNLDFLNNYDNVIRFIEKEYKTNSSIKGYYICIYSVIKDSNFEKNVKKIYYNKMIEFRNKTNEETKENKKTKKQHDNWLDWKDVQTLPGLIKAEMDNLGKLTTKRDKKKHFALYMQYMVAILYTKIPPIRLDYHNMKIIEDDDFDIGDNKFIKFNYILVKNGLISLFLNDYKNFHIMGKIRLEYPKEVVKEILDWIQYLKDNSHRHDYLIYSAKSTKLFSSNAFGQYLERIFIKFLKKEITVNTLRHIYETEIITSRNYNKKTLKEKEKIHSKLLHSFKTAQEYVKLGDHIRFFEGKDEKHKPKKIKFTDRKLIAEYLASMGIEIED